MADARRHSPAADRNRDAILSVLRRYFPPGGVVLEIASGTGQHARHFAPHLPAGATWQPSDPDAEARASVEAWGGGTPRLRLPALAIDVTAPDWHRRVALADIRLVVCINMIHIAPWRAAEGLIRGTAALGVPLFLYGPFKRNGGHTAPSNAAFDASLRAQNSDWGVRELEAVAASAAVCGYRAPDVFDMPANNLSAVFVPGG